MVNIKQLGVLSKSKPFHIIQWRLVPTGTNGGVSLLGTVASAAGGIFVACVYVGVVLVLFPNRFSIQIAIKIVLIGFISGFGGSIVSLFYYFNFE